LLALIGFSCQSENSASERKPSKNNYKNVSVQEFKDLMDANPKAIVLDVRTKEEFQAGHIDGAINLDVNTGHFQQHLSQLTNTNTFLVYCRSGSRSVKACEAMSLAGMDDLYNLKGGFMAWQKEEGK